MSGPNTLQNPNTTDYNLGRGKVYISDLNAAGLPLKWRDIGNTPEFKHSVTTTTVQHEQSMATQKTVDAETVIKVLMEISFNIDELSHENLALFTSGMKNSGVTNPAVAGFTNVTLVLNADCAAGYWYDIETTAGVRAYDILAASVALSVTAPATPAALVVNTDYVLDLQMGRFQLTAAGLVKVNTGGAGIIKIILSADAAASATFDQVQALVATPIKRAVKLVSLNANNNGEPTEYEFHSVQLAATGDASMIADTYTNMGFKGAAQKNNNALYAASPYLTITKATTPR